MNLFRSICAKSENEHVFLQGNPADAIVSDCMVPWVRRSLVMSGQQGIMRSQSEMLAWWVMMTAFQLTDE